MANLITQGEITTQLDAVLGRMEVLTGDLSDDQLRWRSKPGSWSIAECLQHLNQTAIYYLKSMRVAFERERQNAPLAPKAFRIGFLASKFIATLEPPYRLKVKAPRSVQPEQDIDPRAVLDEFHSIRHEIRQFVTESARVDISSIRFPSPFASILKLNLAEGFAVLLAHDRRHLWQAENVRKNPAFPAT